MKLFKGTCELALSQEDVEQAIYEWLVERSAYRVQGSFRLTKCTLNPSNKFVARVTLEPREAATAISKRTATPEAAFVAARSSGGASDG